MSSNFARPERWFDLAAGLMRGDPAVAQQIVEYERQADNAFQQITGNEFTPVVYQLKANGAVAWAASTAIIEGYRVGSLVCLNVQVTISGTGTSASAIWVTLPTALPAKTPTNRSIGQFDVLDTSASSYYSGTAKIVDSGTAVAGIAHNTTAGIGAVAPMSAALAVGDVVGYSIQYITTAAL